MKHIYKYLIVLVVIISLIIYTISSKYDAMTEAKSNTLNNIFVPAKDEITLAKDELVVSAVTPLNSKYPLDYMYKVEDESANLFSLSYTENKLKVGSKIKLRKEGNMASDQLYMLFRETYPNVSLEEMGVSTPEEAYQVVQLAIWEIALRTGEAYYGNELSFIDSIKEDMGYKDMQPKIYEKAKDLVKIVEDFSNNNINDELILQPTLIIDTTQLSVVPTSIGDDYILGKYKYKVNSGIVLSTNIILTDENGNEIDAKVVNSQGVEIKDFTETTEFYIRYPKYHDYQKINIIVKAEVKHIVPCIYEDDYTDYIANTYVIKNIEENTILKFEKN